MRKLSDKELLEALRNGDSKTVLSSLYKTLLPLVVNYIRKNNGNREEAKDIFQDAVVIFYKKVKRGEISEKLNIEAYIFHIAKNLWINYIKKKSRLVYESEITQSPESENFLADMITEERRNAVLQCFDMLGDHCKKLLTYSVYEELSMKEICEKMGYSSEDVAKTYNYRCKQKLMQIIKKNKSVLDTVRE